MAKKKLNPTLLQEELKRYRLLSEYSFYTEEPKKDNDLILGSDLDEADEDPNDDSNTAANAAGAPDAAPNGSPNPVAPTDPSAAPTQAANVAPTDEPADDANNMFSTDAGAEAPETAPADMGDVSAAPEAGGDEVEVDVTQLVQSGEEAKQAADSADQKSGMLLAKFNDLEQKVASMGTLAHKIEDIEREIIKRNPTPIEKLETRFMDSYPYNIKLTDYFKDVDGYDFGPKEDQEKEYVLTKDDVDSGYVDSSVKDSFTVPEDYEEEDI